MFISDDTSLLLFLFFFFNDTATTEIYTLSLHDALPICPRRNRPSTPCSTPSSCLAWADRKSTRLNSSHSQISYAVFCLKKKKKIITSKQVKKKIEQNKKHTQ